MRSPLAAALSLVVLLACVPAASAAGAPLVDAGLDQHVAVGATVHLDAAGTTDPGGRIAGYRWRVRGPDGGAVAVPGTSDGRATFRPLAPGTYTATLTATGADGATASDSLYVRVGRAARYDADVLGFALDGPTRVAVGDTAHYRGTLVGHGPRTVTWQVDGRVVATDRPNRYRSNATLAHRFERVGDH